MSEKELSEEKNLLADIFQSIPTILTALTLSVILLSIAHEWGYFSIIGPNFHAAVTTSDYLANIILWLPRHLLILGAVAPIVVFVVMRKENRDSKEGGIDFRFAVGMAIVGLIVMLFHSVVAGVLTIFFIVCAAGTQYAESRQPPLVQVATFFGISACVVMLFLIGYFTGGLDGRDALLRSNEVYSVTLKPNDKRSVSVLRILEKGVLMHDVMNKTIELERWDEIKSISLKVEETWQSPICRALSRACDWLVERVRDKIR
jgi:hypothetical protein